MATTVPSYNPGSFTNPQRIIDKSFDAFIEGGEKMVNKIATTADQIYERNRIEKETQKLEWEKQNQEQQKLYSSVNELGSTGSSSLDNNLRSFWDGRVDDYFKIKNAMQRGDMPQQEGNRLLASINGEVNKFKTVVPYLAQQVQLQRKAGKIQPGSAGSISSVTSTESQQVLNNLMNGGNTGLVSKGGNMFLYNPAIAGKQNGGMLNIDELIANQATGKSIVQTVPDISKDLTGAFNNIFKPDDVASEYVKFETVKNKDGTGYDYTYKTIEEDKKVSGIQAMKDNGQFNPLLNDEKMMTSVWQDMIPDEYLKANGVNPDSSWMMIDPNKTPAENEAEQDKMREIATNWLAEKAYEDNSQMDQGALKFVSKQKTPAPPPQKPGVDPLKNYSAKAKTEIRNGQDRYNTVIKDVGEFYKVNPTPDAQSVVDQINNTQQIAGGDAQRWWVAEETTYDKDGLVLEEAGKIYSTGDRRGFNPEYFHNRRNLENAALGNLFTEQSTIDYFRSNTAAPQQKQAPKPWPDKATFDANWAAAKTGEQVVGVDGYYYEKP